MREEEQVLSTEPRIGLALCPCAAQHKQKLTWPNSNNVITTEMYTVRSLVITVEPQGSI